MPIIDDTVAGPTSSMASHYSKKSIGITLPASGATAGPHCPRNSRTRASQAGSRSGAGSGIQRLIWKEPLVCERTSAAHARIASGFMSRAPQPPSPPASATAAARDAGQAPAIGAIRIGRRRANASQNARARTRGASELVSAIGRALPRGPRFAIRAHAIGTRALRLMH